MSTKRRWKWTEVVFLSNHRAVREALHGRHLNKKDAEDYPSSRLQGSYWILRTKYTSIHQCSSVWLDNRSAQFQLSLFLKGKHINHLSFNTKFCQSDEKDLITWTSPNGGGRGHTDWQTDKLSDIATYRLNRSRGQLSSSLRRTIDGQKSYIRHKDLLRLFVRPSILLRYAQGTPPWILKRAGLESCGRIAST